MKEEEIDKVVEDILRYLNFKRMPYDREKNAFMNKIENKHGLVFCGHGLIRALSTAIKLSESKDGNIE